MKSSSEHGSDPDHVIHTDLHRVLRRVFELAQDAIIAALCVILLVVMIYSLWTLGEIAFVQLRTPSEILSQIVLLLILVELYRTLIFYLHQHRISVALMVEVALISELREILLYPPTGIGTQVYGNALLLAVLGALLIGIRLAASKMLFSSHPNELLPES